MYTYCSKQFNTLDLIVQSNSMYTQKTKKQKQKLKTKQKQNQQLKKKIKKEERKSCGMKKD